MPALLEKPEPFDFDAATSELDRQDRELARSVGEMSGYWSAMAAALEIANKTITNSDDRAAFITALTARAQEERKK